MIPTILASLSHRHVGVRFAACQCVRVLGRAVKVIRTNIFDSGLGKSVFQIFKKQDEDRNVTNAALSAMCNIVNEFSPLRLVSLVICPRGSFDRVDLVLQDFMEDGLVERSIQLLNTQDPTLKLNSLWLLRNLVYKTTVEIKKEIMAKLGWPYFSA
jgi:armadillo repeat-containing protein 8